MSLDITQTEVAIRENRLKSIEQGTDGGCFFL